MCSQNRTHLYCQTYCKKWAHIRHQGEVLEIQSTKTPFLVLSGSQFTARDRGPSTQDTAVSAGLRREVEWVYTQPLCWKVRSKSRWFISLIYQNLQRVSRCLPKQTKKTSVFWAQWVLSTLANSVELSWLPLRYILRPWHILRYRSSAWHGTMDLGSLSIISLLGLL